MGMEQVISISEKMSCATEFEIILKPYLHHLYKVALRFTGGVVADSEDLLQELLVKLYGRREQLETIEKLRPWLVKVLYRIFIDNVRRQNRSPLHLVVKPSGEEPDPVDMLACSGSGPAESMAHGAMKSQLMAAVDSLKEDQRTVCVLHDMEGYTLIELEDILETPLGTLKSRLHRARARLRKILRLQGVTSKREEHHAEL